MRDVAARAGVSLKTVSRVVNHEPVVEKQTVAKVEKAIAELRYRRDSLARNLRTGIRQLSIGLVIEDLENPFYALLAQAVEEIADANDHALILTSSREDPEREQRFVLNLITRGVEGLLIVPASHDHRYLTADLARGVKVVFLDRRPGGVAADAVLSENRAGARKAVGHLIAHGHRRIGLIADPIELETSAERYQGYCDALAAAGIDLDERLVLMHSHTADSAEAATHELLMLDQPPTAIFAENNRNCVGVLRALQTVGATLAVVGFDDFELASLLPVPVTVIANDPREMGRQGAELLFQRLSGVGGAPVERLIPSRLIERGTGEIELARVHLGSARPGALNSH
jgi:LacI family transcriptional regulator, galactose operon repressor